MIWIKSVKIVLIFTIFLCKICYGSSRDSQTRDAIEDLITSAGFNAESYIVETEDNYLLKIHRIRSKIRSVDKNLAPIFFMHGLFATAADYLMTGPTNGLPYLFANMGYDCWLGNSRGSDYGLGHRTMNSNTKDFWNFSFHEIGHLDVPAFIDFVLNATGAEKVFYIGHSQGCTSLMVLLSTRPNYNQKIIEAHLMAPAVFMANFPNPLIRFFASEFDAFIDRTKNYDLISNSQIMNIVERMNSIFCQTNSPIMGMCTNAIQMICGRNDNGTETDSRVLPILIKYLAHAVSTKQINHYIQMYQSGKFQQYNYGMKNKAIYGQSYPPEYELKNVKIPISIYAGKNDMLVAEKDIDHLREVLQNVKRYKVIKNFNHCDFNYGTHAKNFVFNYIIKSINQYK
ncbi:hypothetical protein PVAND_015102 [Polypedilum vanderplanki]|uniref:Lipase n=1 Tax=Polypedilum vanderplanki TaxID=319348 RepID=A0A9J6BBQ2_POLVA|nr:hypothetical protein PVAND_015102 [Polypedilum vanderplanki]